jgi:hypothetical protein
MINSLLLKIKNQPFTEYLLPYYFILSSWLQSDLNQYLALNLTLILTSNQNQKHENRCFKRNREK